MVLHCHIFRLFPSVAYFLHLTLLSFSEKLKFDGRLLGNEKVSSNGQQQLNVLTSPYKLSMDYSRSNMPMNSYSYNENNNFFATPTASRTSLSLSRFTPEPV